MNYFWAIFLPPIAAYRAGGAGHCLLNCGLMLLFLPAVIHAVILVASDEAEKRNQAILREMRKLRRAQEKPQQKPDPPPRRDDPEEDAAFDFLQDS